MVWDVEVDCAGLLCPLPVLRARKRLISMQPGQVLALLATDKMAAIDLPHFCAEAGHGFLGAQDLGAQDLGAQDLGAQEAGGTTRYLIRRG